MKVDKALLPILAGFFVMGFGDIIGTVMIQVKSECSAHADAIAWLMPVFAYCWFLLISIPTAGLPGVSPGVGRLCAEGRLHELV